MTRFSCLASSVLCVLALCIDPACGCQYNVREVGFIDVGIEPYRLFVYPPQTVAPGEIGVLKDAIDAALIDTNIRCEPILPGADVNDPALGLLSLHDIDSYPAAVLVSPDSQSRRVDLPAGQQSLAEAISLAMEAVLDSPSRRQILEKAADCYGVVLLIEGPQHDRNVAAREAISTAIAQIGGQLEDLPKLIAKGPEMVVLDHSSLAREEVLLWTLGLKLQDVNEPLAAIFYGRGRWIGPLFKGEMLTPENLAQVLSVIGADCECGLDHRWLQGTMLPARWVEELRQRVTASLGFDPESPVVKMEMVSIIRRGMGGVSSPDMPFGYREIEVGGDVPGVDSEPNFAISSRTPAVALPESGVVQAQIDPGRERSGLGILAASLGGMVVLVSIASIVIVLRTRKA